MSHITLAVDIEAIATKYATAAEAALLDVCDGCQATSVLATAEGSSKRDPGDKYDESIGVDLAVGRALEALGRRLQRRADGKVRAASEARRVREEKAARSDGVTGCANLQDYLAATLAQYGVADYPAQPEPADHLARLRAALEGQGFEVIDVDEMF